MQKSADHPNKAAELARHELIGREVRIAESNDPTLQGRQGLVVDETMKTLTLEHETRRVVVGKLGQTFSFTINGDEVLLSGRDLAYRPEDRIKKARVKR